MGTNNLYASRDGDPSLSPLWANIVGKPATFTPSSHGDSAHSETYVKVIGTPVNNQIGVWTGANTLEGDTNLTWDGSVLGVIGKIRAKYSDLGIESYINTVSGHAFIDSIKDDGGYKIYIRVRALGTPINALTINGDGSIQSVGEITAYA